MNEKTPAKKTSVWLVICLFCFAATASAAFIPAAAGQPISGQTGSSLLLWGALSMWLLWRHNGRNQAVGLVIGIVSGLAIFFLASVVSGAMRH